LTVLKTIYQLISLTLIEKYNKQKAIKVNNKDKNKFTITTFNRKLLKMFEYLA
jgi:hypothetical protein